MKQRKRSAAAGGLLLATAMCVRPAVAQDDVSGRVILTPIAATEVPAIPVDAQVSEVPAVPYDDGGSPAAVPAVPAVRVSQPCAAPPCAEAGCAEDGGSGISAWMQQQKAKWRDRMFGYPEEFQRPPVGMAVHGLLERQRQQAQAARMTLYRYDFKAGSSELNAAGQGRLARISRQLRVGHGAIFVEASGAGPMLDTARRESVTELLKSLQQEVSVDSVQAIGAPEFSLDSESALLIHANRLQQTKSRGGSSGISGGGSSAGGGGGAQSGGLIQ